MTFADLALICLVGLVGPFLAVNTPMRVPVVVGELVVGIALGTTGLRLLHADHPTFSFMAEIGFGLVMFVAGSHVPVRDPALRAGVRAGALRAVAVGLLSLPAGFGLAALFGTGRGLLYAVLLASSSASLIMPALSGMPLTGPSVIAMLPQIAIADAACIVALPLAMDPGHALRAAGGAAAVAVAAAVVFGFLWWAERRGLRRRVHRVSHERELAVELRTSLTLLFGLCALAAATHVSIMLAGFALGLAVAGVGAPRRLAKQLFALTEGFFGPIFFVWLGASLDLRTLVDQPSGIALGVALGLAAAAVHGAMVLAGQPLPVALITCAQLGVPVAAATIGTTSGALSPHESAGLLLGALVTIAVVTAVAGAVRRVAQSEAPQPEPVAPT